MGIYRPLWESLGAYRPLWGMTLMNNTNNTKNKVFITIKIIIIIILFIMSLINGDVSTVDALLRTLVNSL